METPIPVYLVLVVDADARFVDDVRLLFAGQRILTARTLDEAAEIVPGGRVDLVLLGPTLGTEEALRAAGSLALADPGVPIVAAANIVTDRMLLTAGRAGMAAVVPTPLTLRSVADLLSHARSPRRATASVVAPHLEPTASPVVVVEFEARSGLATPAEFVAIEPAPSAPTPATVATDLPPVAAAPLSSADPHRSAPGPDVAPRPIPADPGGVFGPDPLWDRAAAAPAPRPRTDAAEDVVPSGAAFVAAARSAESVVPPAPAFPPPMPMPVELDAEPVPLRIPRLSPLDAVLPPPMPPPPAREDDLVVIHPEDAASPPPFSPPTAAAAGRGLQKQGRVVAVMAGKGGSGKTVTATNLAMALTLQRGADRVAIVDTDLQFGDVALLLQLDPSRTLVDAARRVDELSDAKLDAMLLRHESGLRVLPAPVLPTTQVEVPAKLVVRLLERLRALYEVVVVDTAPIFDDHLVSILEEADDVLVVVDMDLPSVKNAKIALDALRGSGFPMGRLQLVVNRVNAKARLDLVELERSLGLRVAGSIPSDRLVPQSVNEGIPVVALSPRSRVARAFHILAGLVHTNDG